MARTRIVWHRGEPFMDVINQWVQNDGLKRAGRVAAAMKSSGVTDVKIVEDLHPKRTSIHIGSDDRAALYKESRTGRMARALSAAG